MRASADMIMRQRYAREHQHWTMDDWSKVMFTDEYKFMLYKHDGRQLVYRRPGERFHQDCVEEKVAHVAEAEYLFGLKFLPRPAPSS